MKVLVTGGAGFIGSQLVDKLIEKKNDVIIVDNLSTGKRENINSEAKFYYVDITDSENLNDIFRRENPEIVFHLAANAMLRVSIEDPIFDAKVNILGTISVLEACRKNNVKKIIYTSTGGARVGEPEKLPVDEKHPIKPCSPYGISKHSAEHYVWMYSKLYGIDYFIFCFGNVYGKRDDEVTKRLIPVFIEKIFRRESPGIFGDGSKTRDFIYVNDLVELLVGSIEKLGKTEHQLFHLANGKEISVKEIYNLLKEISGTSVEVKYLDEIKGEVQNIVLDTTLVNKELGWNPKTDIEKGLQETWEWFKEKNRV